MTNDPNIPAQQYLSIPLIPLTLFYIKKIPYKIHRICRIESSFFLQPNSKCDYKSEMIGVEYVKLFVTLSYTVTLFIVTDSFRTRATL